jgi:hypothetical protein
MEITTQENISRILTNSLLDKGCCLYLDNWYTGHNLVCTVSARSTSVVGRKEFPDFVKTPKLQKGEVVKIFSQKEMIFRWKYKRHAIVLSAYHDGALEELL